MSTANSSKAPLSQRLKDLTVEYGSVAVWTYFGIFAIVLLAFAGAIQFGLHTGTTAGKAGVWGAAYLATKLTQPFRIAATLALTPLVMKLSHQRKRSETGS